MNSLRRALFFLGFMLLATFGARAQERVEALKAAFITRDLQLSPAESRDFWPVYNQYIGELKQARAQFATDEIAFTEASLNIGKRYRNDFRRILMDDNRVNRVFLEERRFIQLLNQEHINRQGRVRMGPRGY